MSLEVNGMQEIIDQMDKMLISSKSNEPLKEAGDYVKDVEKKVAWEKHHKYSQKVGINALKRFPIKTKGNFRSVSVGIKGSQTKREKAKEAKRVAAGEKRATYWDKVKGLYYNNYGFLNARTGRYVAGSDWIQTAYDESKTRAFEIIKDGLLKVLDE